jgi:hypothetical protein
MKKLVVVVFLAVVLAGSTAFGAFTPVIGNVRPVTIGSAPAGEANLTTLFPFFNSATDQLPYDYFVANPFSDLSEFTILFEYSGFENQNTVGIYSYADTTQLLPIFSGNASEGWRALANFLSNGSVTVTLFNDVGGFEGQSNSAFAGNIFGLYITNGFNETFYSDDAGNPLEKAQFVAFSDETPVFPGMIFAFEDLGSQSQWNSDYDYNDIIIHAQSINPVPEPGTLILLGTGLLGMAITGMRKKFRR